MSDLVQQKKPQKLFFRHILKKVFLEDWGLKLVALAITLALWLGVTGLSTPTKTRIQNVPLNLNVASDTQITNIPQQQIEIEISGDKRKVDQIARGELTAFVSLTDMPAGNWVVTLSPDIVFVPLPQGVKLVDVVPGRIGINIEAVEEKEFDVQPETIGEVASGFEVYSSAAIPSRIRVRGPASVVRVLEYVQTDRIDISDKKADFTARQVAVSSPNAQAAILNTVVDVIFHIGERRIERTFTAPISGEPGKTVTFTVFGPKTPLQKTKVDEFKVEMYIDGMGELKPQVTLPADLENLSEVKKLKVN
ncbi:MAG: CdaR family protein [Pyrinomonadaceae bacterium]